MGQSKIDNPETKATLGTRHRTKTNKTKISTENWKRWATQTPPKKRGWTQILAKIKQFLLLTRLLSCYSYSRVC